MHKPFLKRAGFAVSAMRQFSQQISYWEECDGFIFSWGENGLQPARKRRLVVKPALQAVTLDLLIHELKTGSMR